MHIALQHSTGVISGGISEDTSEQPTLPTNWVLVDGNDNSPNDGYLIGPGADLQNADFQGASLLYVDLQGADLQGANLWPANGETYLDYSNLQSANLTGANLSGTATNTNLLFEDNLQTPLSAQPTFSSPLRSRTPVLMGPPARAMAKRV